VKYEEIMEVDAVERMIAEAIADEEQTGRLAKALRERAAGHRRRVTSTQLEGAIGFVRDYVSHVPVYMREGLEAARMAGVEREMSRVLEEAASYWQMKDDIIPDQLGLLGVIDDAYCSLTLIQAVSDRYEQETGRPLFSHDLNAANEAMRRFIGEPTASQLDMYVGGKLQADPMMQMVRALTAVSSKTGGFSVSQADHIWDGLTTDEILRAATPR
jgi:hypothetical protein